MSEQWQKVLHNEDDILVCFFEQPRTFSWIPIADIQPWNDKVNSIMLAQKGYKDAHLKAMYAAYKIASEESFST